jgi:alkyldihydroxyacetonephosphate synthase
MGGIINDHHGVGLDLGRHIELQHGPIGIDILRKIKKVLDPNWIMNPGKLGL